MKCPYCGDQDSKVIDSRHSEDGASIRRRRECLACQKRFTTYETVESLPIIVVKKDGSRQSFDENGYGRAATDLPFGSTSKTPSLILTKCGSSVNTPPTEVELLTAPKI